MRAVPVICLVVPSVVDAVGTISIEVKHNMDLTTDEPGSSRFENFDIRAGLFPIGIVQFWLEIVQLCLGAASLCCRCSRAAVSLVHHRWISPLLQPNLVDGGQSGECV